jgi:hypothetical protein
MLSLTIKRIATTIASICSLVLPLVVQAYPLDGYEETGIRRVEGYRLMTEGVIPGGKVPSGARLPTERVDLRLTDQLLMPLPPVDADLTAKVAALLDDHGDNFGIALLDLSDKEKPRYAEINGHYRQNVGSVGKVVGALGFFQALSDTYPDDIRKREALLKNTIVTADQFSQYDHHAIKVFDIKAKVMNHHSLQIGEQGNVWEYLDWMLSVSSNGAAAMIMREAMLLRHYGEAYPVPEAEIQRFFEETPKGELTALYKQTFWQPISRNGMDIEQLRQGSFFTRNGKEAVYGGGNSYGTARSLMQFSLLMEQGQLVDQWSSRQLKRLLYMTERRIRYASSPALSSSAVYFKSGSLYSCKNEEGFHCGKYQGNVKNYMNSLAIVESQNDTQPMHYIVIVVSNVLKVNSAVAHQTLATKIQQLLEKENTIPAPAVAGK